MHAVLVNVSISDPEAATRYLQEEIVPRVSQVPGFVAGYWIRVEGGNHGRATIVFESEEAARSVAGQIQPAPGAATLDSIDVGEVIVNA